jgi:hypothetical protein
MAVATSLSSNKKKQKRSMEMKCIATLMMFSSSIA